MIGSRIYDYLHLRRGLSKLDAFKLSFLRTHEKKDTLISLCLPGYLQPILLRHGTSDLLCFDKVFLQREYESPINIQPKTIVDAGANIGMSTLFFHHQYPNAEILSIEPESSNFSLLKLNCMGLSGVTLQNAALWPRKCRLQLDESKTEKWAFTVREADLEGSVDVVTVPEILASLKVERIDLLKLDIEGAERELFSGAANEWLPRVGVIVIELHDRNIPHCAKSFYSALSEFDFHQEVRGENIFVYLNHS